MPSTIPNHDNALFDTIRSLERRVQALETRRRGNRPWGSYYAGNGITYATGADRVILWDEWSESTFMMNPFAGLLSVPNDGVYESTFITGKAGTARLATVKVFRSNTGTTLASRDLLFDANDYFNVWHVPLTLNAGDTIRITVNPSGGNLTLATDAAWLFRKLG